MILNVQGSAHTYSSLPFSGIKKPLSFVYCWDLQLTSLLVTSVSLGITKTLHRQWLQRRFLINQWLYCSLLGASCRLTHFLARKGRYVSMLQYDEDMSQCHQLRIGLALRPFCLLFLSTLLYHSHDIGTGRLS